MKLYGYKRCSTCRKAEQFLEENKCEYKGVEIRETPPSYNELRKMLSFYGGNIKALFNSSGQDYRNQNIKEKLVTMSTDQALELLSKDGRLVKRPFIIKDGWGAVGFKEDHWRAELAI